MNKASTDAGVWLRSAPKLLRAQRLLAAQGGDYLFVYAIEDGQLIMWVLAAGNRRDVSRQMVWLRTACAGRL